MILNIIYIIAGLILVIWGADKLTGGASDLAARMGVPQIIIGLTIVAIGTSMPEFSVSLLSAIQGKPGLAVGNVVGSNIFNVLLIVGTAAAVAPIEIQKSTVHKDMPWTILASVFLFTLGADGEISRLDAVVLIAALCAFMVITLQTARKGMKAAKNNNNETTPHASADGADNSAPSENALKKSTPVWLSIGFVIIGLACLIFGSQLFVNAATSVAKTLHVSDAVIGLTIVAGGTSLPELATSVVAAQKGRSGIAIGNVIGSNIMNILLILGVTGTITPLSMQGITPIDFATMGGSILILWLFTFTKYRVERWEGWALLALFAAYMAWLLANAY